MCWPDSMPRSGSWRATSEPVSTASVMSGYWPTSPWTKPCSRNGSRPAS
jgi:hypothetical protein